MNDKVDEILNEEEAKDAVDELAEAVKDFGNIEFFHVMWATKKDGVMTQRYLGDANQLVACLERSKFALLKDMECFGGDELE